MVFRAYNCGYNTQMDPKSINHESNRILENHIIPNNCAGCAMNNCQKIADEYAKAPKNCCSAKLKNRIRRMIVEELRIARS